MKQCPFCLEWMDRQEKKCGRCSTWVVPRPLNEEEAAAAGFNDEHAERRTWREMVPSVLQTVGLVIVIVFLCLGIPHFLESSPLVHRLLQW